MLYEKIEKKCSEKVLEYKIVTLCRSFTRYCINVAGIFKPFVILRRLTCNVYGICLTSFGSL